MFEIHGSKGAQWKSTQFLCNENEQVRQKMYKKLGLKQRYAK